MAQLTVVAKIRAKAGAREQVLEELERLVEPTREKDAGCIAYDLYRDEDDPDVFFFLEIWESRECLDRHQASAHIAAYRKAAGALIEERVIHRLTRVA